MNRRTFLLGAFGNTLPLADYVVTGQLSDGSIIKSGYVNGYPYQRIARIANTGIVSRFELTVTARKESGVYDLLLAAGTAMELRYYNDQALLVKADDIRASFHVLIDGQLFLWDNIVAKRVTASQVVRVQLVSSTTGQLEPQ